MACNETCIVIFQTVIYNKIKTIGVLYNENLHFTGLARVLIK